MSLKRGLYSLFLYLIFPLVLIRLLWRSRANPAYRKRISERLGFSGFNSDLPVIWVHAVSVGETIAAKPLIEVLVDHYPDHRVLVTTTTPTGSDRVRALFKDRVEHVYFPYDLPGAVKRFLRTVQPKILIVIETEIWPNLFAQCGNNNISLLIVNARLSKKSTHAYSRIRGLVAETLKKVNLIAVRSDVDAQRFKQLGANDNQIKTVGNIKFDIDINQQQIEYGKERREQWGSDRPVWVAASTHAGEDEIILITYSNILRVFPKLILVLVPRHPERFGAVFKLSQNYQKEGVAVVRHSQTKGYGENEVNIILGDSMGEMQSWYAGADVVFIGGSLVNTGGHNPLEATALGVPVVSGPYMFNFDDLVTELTATDLLTVCENQNEIESELVELLYNRKNKELEDKAKKLMQRHRGVTARLDQLVSKFI